jgi:hypothetical protein
MRKTWVLDTETKGTGANMVPLEKVEKKADAEPSRPPRRARKASPPRQPLPRRASEPAEKTSTALPPGHVRKRATGEIGKVRAVDAKAGQATVQWLKRGDVSVVPLSAISRR